MDSAEEGEDNCWLLNKKKIVLHVTHICTKVRFRYKQKLDDKKIYLLLQLQPSTL